MKLKKPTLLPQNTCKRLIFDLIYLTFLLYLGSKPTFAQDVSQSLNASYQINENGRTHISYDILLSNLATATAIKSYSLSLSQANPQNIEVFDQNTPLTPQITKEGSTYSIKIDFNEPSVGKGVSRKLKINLTDDSLALKSGNVWEITLPGIVGENFEGVAQTLTVPNSFGELAYISPEPVDIQIHENNTNYIFNQNKNPKAISAAFGEFQVFSFGITYHLENPSPKKTTMEIAIPPDTDQQKIFYEDINPKPENLRIDEDGNWLAQYTLESHESKEVKAVGSVQIFSFIQKHTANPIYLKKMLTTTTYWQTDNSNIKAIAKDLKTPKAIYDYVVSTLSYDYDRVRPEVKRFGAIQALKNPDKAMCMEFTDLFIALARAANIPAREINGYAYTENSKLQPLSLVADILHAWPEYWDSQKQRWIPVDPTWGKTSGLDYFDKLDLNHFTFVIHGINPEIPYAPGSYKLGAHPQKDVYVSFSRLPEIKEPTVQLTINKKDGISLKNVYYEVTLYNPGPTALYNQNLELIQDGNKSIFNTVEVLPPFKTHKMTIKIPMGILERYAPKEISVYFAGSGASILPNTLGFNLVIVTLIFILIFSITAFLFWKLKRK